MAATKTDGTLWTWGGGATLIGGTIIFNTGQLGVNDITNRLTPVTTFAGGSTWSQFSCGDLHTTAVKTDGTLWTWGGGDLVIFTNAGQLGVNDITNRLTPVTTFAGGSTWSQVAGGGGHSAAIKTDGTLWTWGLNDYGQLGINDIPNLYPAQVYGGGTNWKKVSGWSSVQAIKTDGTLWTWGRNSTGRLGTNDTADRYTPVTTFAGGTNWKQTSAKTTSIAAIKTDGTLWTWGGNNFGQLGTNDIDTRCTPVTTFAGGTNWKQVDNGYYHTVALTSGTDPTYFIS